MPIIHLEGPKIEDIQTKRTLVKELTDAAVNPVRDESRCKFLQNKSLALHR